MKKLMIVTLLSVMVAAPAFAEQLADGLKPCVGSPDGSAAAPKKGNEGVVTGGGTTPPSSGTTNAGSASGADKKGN